MTAIITVEKLEADKYQIQGSEIEIKANSDEEDLDVHDEDDDFAQDQNDTKKVKQYTVHNIKKDKVLNAGDKVKLVIDGITVNSGNMILQANFA
tara:strand:+ start:226 stop:507 length:282 start_codon:yes stop_codon:yes gene_type:complete